MQAEKRGFSWAHWNMYQNQNSSKGMGPWIFSEQIQNPEQRSFDAPLEALVGHYEFEDGTTGGGVSIANDQPGFREPVTQPSSLAPEPQFGHVPRVSIFPKTILTRLKFIIPAQVIASLDLFRAMTRLEPCRRLTPTFPCHRRQ